VTKAKLIIGPTSEIVHNWNWKAALLSAAGRAPIFLIATAGYGWRSMSIAAGIEFAYRAVSAGFFASIIQSARRSPSRWNSAFQITVLVPGACLLLDYLLHRALGTPNLKTGFVISFAVSCVTSLFNWYSMNRGVLMVGAESKSLLADLKALPATVAGFLIEPPRRVWRLGRQVMQSSVISN
jgi:hypothetical protein